MSRLFDTIARWLAYQAGQPLAFILATLSVILWAIAGPFFAYSDTWQLVINTSTTVLTFLMVFLVQASVNRDTKAVQIKLDELIHANDKARDDIIRAEDRAEVELDQLRS